MAGYSYTWSNKKRDVLEAYDIIRKQSPLLLGLIGTGAVATNPKVEWLEDSIGYRTFVATANSSGVLTVSADDAAKLAVGSLVMATGYPDLFKVSAISGTSVTVAVAANHGGSLTAATFPTNTVARIIGDPKAENSSAGDGLIHQASTAYNYTQIFRKDVALSRTAIQTAVYGNLDNQINHQVNLKLDELVRDMNGVLVFGTKQERGASALGMAGGLYDYATGSSALEVDALSNAFDDILVNDAVQAIDGNAQNLAVLTCPAQARVLGAACKDQVRIVREDRARGTYVAEVVNALNGSLMTIVADPNLNVVPTDAWVLDLNAIKIRHMQAPYDFDSTNADTDGVRRSIIAESTFEFNNIKLRACRIKALQAASTAMAGLRGGAKVRITNSTSDPVNTKEVSSSSAE